MANKPLRQKMLVSMETLEILNVVFFTAAVGVAILTDGNSRVAGLSEVVSFMIMVVVYTITFAVALDITIRGRGLQKILGIIPLLVYLAVIVLVIKSW